METVELKRSSKEAVTLRFSVNQGEVYHLPELTGLHVVEGVLWVTQHGQDIVLYTGDALTDDLLSEGALVSVVGGETAIVEMIVPHPDAATLPLRAVVALKHAA